MQNETKNVMHFVHWSRSGITSLVKNLCRREAHSLMLLNNDVDFFGEYEGIKRATTLQADSKKILWLFIYFKTLKSVRPKILHCHSFTPFLIASVFSLGVNIIFHVHNEYPYLSDNDARSKLKRAIIKILTYFRSVTLIAVSERSASALERITAQHCYILPNALPDEGSMRAPFSIQASSGRFYSVCRLSEQKNLKFAIKLFKIISLREPNINITYDIYGEGPLKDELDSLIHSLELEHIVKLKGWCSNPDSLAEKYDFYLSTSTFEGFGLSILDSLRGMNVAIITNVGELSKNLLDKKSCFLIEFDEEKASEVILNVMSMPKDILKKVQFNGRDLYLRKYGYVNYVVKLEDIYRGCREA